MASRHTIPGSERNVLEGARAVGPARADERFEVTLRLRAKTPASHALAASGAGDDTHPAQRRYLTREQYAAAHGADAQNLAQVATFAKSQGLAVVESDAARRSVVLSGTTQAMNSAFGVDLQQYEHDGGTYRGRVGGISVPGDLAGIVEGVFGLDNRLGRRPALPALRADPRHACHRGKGVHAAGTCQAVRLPGRRRRERPMHRHHRARWGLQAGRPRHLFRTAGHAANPTVKPVLLGGATNHPTNTNSADGEVLLDIEVAAAIAPKATIAVYFTPNTTAGFLNAITTAVHDTVNKPSVISISWGSSESNWTSQAMTQYDQAFQRRRGDGRSPSAWRPATPTGRPTAFPAVRRTSTSPRRARMRWAAAAPSCWPAPPRSRPRRCGTKAPRPARAAAA